MTSQPVRIEKHSDGHFHGRRDDEDVTLCGRRRERQKAGRPAKAATCAACLEVIAAEPSIVEPEPAPAARPALDPRCSQCGKPRKPERSRKYAGLLAEADPFCSTECCKRFYGVVSVLTDDERGEPDERLAEEAA